MDKNQLIAEYRMPRTFIIIAIIHNASRRSQKAARYVHNANGLGTSSEFLKFLASGCIQNVSEDIPAFYMRQLAEFLKSLGELAQQIHPI